MKRLTVSAYVSSKLARTKKDFRRDTFFAGGKGGQNQNKVETGVRLTCLKTGLSAEGREERSQLANHNIAFYRLVDKLVAHYQEEEKSIKIGRIKSATEEIRVYKDKTSLVKDSLTGVTGDYKETLDGSIGKFIKARMLKASDLV